MKDPKCIWYRRGNYSNELSHNNIEAPIPKVTTSTIVEAKRDLKENQNKMIDIFKPTTSATIQ